MTHPNSQSNSAQPETAVESSTDSHSPKSGRTEEFRPLSRRTMVMGLLSLGGLHLGSRSVMADTAPDPDDYDDLLDSMQGEGTAKDPYIIKHVRQLQAIEAERGANYRLGKDINARATKNWNRAKRDAKGFDPISSFSGSLDGNGHSLTHLTINRPEENYVGLFGEIGFFGTVEDLRLESIDYTGKNRVGGIAGKIQKGSVTASSVTGTLSGNDRVGGLAGITNRVSIIGLSATVDLTGNVRVGGLVGRIFNGFVRGSSARGDVSGNDRVGGIAGATYEATVTESYATGDVTGTDRVGGLVGEPQILAGIQRSYATGDVSGETRVGGLAGDLAFESTTAPVEDSYATGDVSGDDRVGGLAGNLDGLSGFDHVRRSYAVGEVTGDTRVGGVLGNIDVGKVTESYWDAVATGQDTGIGSGDGGITGLETEQMQGGSAKSTMDALNFEETWKVVTAPDDYPVLQWQGDVADVTFNDQDAKGASVNVASVTLPDGGFVVLHEEGPGAVIGHSQSLDSGTHEDLNVAIKRGKVDKEKRKQDRTLVAMAHRDSGREGKYEFPEADPPYLDDDDNPIIDSAKISF